MYVHHVIHELLHIQVFLHFLASLAFPFGSLCKGNAELNVTLYISLLLYEAETEPSFRSVASALVCSGLL